MDESQVESVSAGFGIKHKGSKKRMILFFAVLIILIVGALGGLALYGRTFSDRVLTHVRIGDIAFGKMNKDQIRATLNAMNDKLLATPIRITLSDRDQVVTLPVEVVGGGEAYSYFSLDVDQQTNSLLNLGKSNNLIITGWNALTSHWSVTAEHLTVNEDRLMMDLSEQMSSYQTQPENASLQITSLEPFAFTISPEKTGTLYLDNREVQEIREAWSLLRAPVIHRTVKTVIPQITEKDVREQGGLIPLFLQAPIVLTFTDPDTRVEKKWTLSERRLADFVLVDTQSTPAITLSFASTTQYISDVIGKELNVPARDARFEIDETGRVIEFEGSRTGISLDVDAAYTQIVSAFTKRVDTATTTPDVIGLTTLATDPEISTGEVNDLGITHLLGVGISNFSGSPSNRIKNIRNAVNKLNGILIKPGEEFSAIAYTQPYTIEGGYLPEKVIKGDRIIPEIGGGLCQVGTTLFRMAMNSGLEITERRNHSLVVSYYNDLSNGLPGTDATIYDPNPDFRFKNDTNGYILIQTEMNVNTGELRFSLWGTNDGRRGYYSKPTVHNWFSAGETKIVETTSLPAGVKECQHAYRGANTSFTYTREFADGRTEDKVFESHYRALPQICLVGVESVAPACEGEECLPSEQPAEESSAEEPVVPEALVDPIPDPTV